MQIIALVFLLCVNQAFGCPSTKSCSSCDINSISLEASPGDPDDPRPPSAELGSNSGCTRLDVVCELSPGANTSWLEIYDNDNFFVGFPQANVTHPHIETLHCDENKQWTTEDKIPVKRLVCHNGFTTTPPVCFTCDPNGVVLEPHADLDNAPASRIASPSDEGCLTMIVTCAPGPGNEYSSLLLYSKAGEQISNLTRSDNLPSQNVIFCNEKREWVVYITEEDIQVIERITCHNGHK